MTARAAHTLLSRRALLAQGGALVVTFALAPRPIHAEAARPADKTVAADEVAGFISIDATGKITIYSGKVELGTGAITAIAQIAAEELSVSLDRVTMIQGDTQLTPNQGPTYASLSIQDGGMAYYDFTNSALASQAIWGLTTLMEAWHSNRILSKNQILETLP